MKKIRISRIVLCCFIGIVLFSGSLEGKEIKNIPKEFGVYVRTPESLKRLTPNIVFNSNGILYLESNNPSHFLLKDVGAFVIYGKYDINVLTLNPLLFFQQSPIGKLRFVFGKDINVNIKKQANDLWLVTPKGLLGRGYFTLWINDAAWDFIVE